MVMSEVILGYMVRSCLIQKKEEPRRLIWKSQII